MLRKLQIFSGCVFQVEQLHARSPFLFPMVFRFLFSILRGLNCRCLLWIWQLDFGDLLRASMSNLSLLQLPLKKRHTLPRNAHTVGDLHGSSSGVPNAKVLLCDLCYFFYIDNLHNYCLGYRRSMQLRPVDIRRPHEISVFLASRKMFSCLRFGLF